MDLPAELRMALERLLEGTPARVLAPIAAAQSRAYRERADHGLPRLLVASRQDALAYAAWRLPATYVATRHVLAEVTALAPDLRVTSQLDLGAGPGTAALAAGGIFEALTHVVALEGAAPFRALGAGLFDGLEGACGATPDWRAVDLAATDAVERALGDARFDLVTVCYVTGEIDADARGALIDAAWAHTEGVLVLVEPGTTLGHQRVLAARARLIDAGAHVLGPCPHAAACPVVAPDWCHFAARVPRSKLHRQVKAAELGWEDEKLAWLAVAREPAATRPPGRVLRPPRIGRAKIELAVCGEDGALHVHEVARRSKDAWRRAKKLRWGDALPAELGSRD
jgi:ribosomal protein RSM22 (predicted rRNA methylase)